MKEALSNYGENIENLTPNKLVYDNHGRAHLYPPNAGRSYVFVRAQRFNGTTISTHITDLHNISTREENQKPGQLILSDSGSDFTSTSLLNMIYYYRLFKLLDLDILNICTYASRYSAFNCIEHLWSPLSRNLAGVVFPNTLQGESKPPIHQGDLTKDQCKEKEKQI